MQTRLSIISNIIFKYFIIFAITFLWLNFYISNLITIGIGSVIISVLLGTILNIISKKRKNAINLSFKEQEQMREISLQFLLAEKNQLFSFFKLLLETKHDCNIPKSKNCIDWENNAFIPFYNHSIITADDVANIFKDNKNKINIFIASIGVSDEAKKLAEQIKQSKIILLDESQVFKILKKYDLYPDFKIELNKKEKFKYSKLKDIAFTKSNTKHYFISAFIILITSFFIRYNTYYLIFATILFIFAGISFLKPIKKLPDSADEL